VIGVVVFAVAVESGTLPRVPGLFDTVQAVNIEPAAAGLDLICEGIRLVSDGDPAAIERGRVVFDALYARLSREQGTKG
jgi:hypothetical protein